VDSFLSLYTNQVGRFFPLIGEFEFFSILPFEIYSTAKAGQAIGCPPPDVKAVRTFNRGEIIPTGLSKMDASRQRVCKSDFFNGFIFA
jgi:hypothetical protein